MLLQYGRLRGMVERSARLFLLILATGMTAAIVEARAQPAEEAPIKLAVLGDSLTAGYGLQANAAFPVRLQQALKDKGYNVDVLNAGVSGDTASGGRDRLDWSIPQGTRAVIVELGANDMLRGVDPKITRAALEEIITKLRARNVAVLLCGMKAAPNWGPDYVNTFDAIYPDLAKQYGVPLYPFFLDGVAGDKTLNQPDGLHPLASGVDIIVKNILPMAEAFVRKLSPAPRI